MPDAQAVRSWPEKIRKRYENYLKTSFFFRDPGLRASFQAALQEEASLLKGPFAEPARDFDSGVNARDLARECFPETAGDLLPALMDNALHSHQERAMRAAHVNSLNVVVATGTASGKTESFLYPILFELYRQHLAGDLGQPGVRAMILYPMNALANDQRERLGKIIGALHEADSEFRPTFGQYIGQTPEDAQNKWRNADWWDRNSLPGEQIFRKDMRKTPPHILLANYSMLEYLLIRPNDSPLFDDGRGERWQFLVLDEAHQYRGAKGMEMGMLIRRLKQRLRDGGRRRPFSCIATSATLSSGESDADQRVVAEFAQELFGEPFSEAGIVFGASSTPAAEKSPRRYHAFLRALEGAFLANTGGADAVVLNRKSEAQEDGAPTRALEIALCRECGQHYYVGREQGGHLQEAVRDPSHPDFGVTYYLRTEDGDELLCRRCGALSEALPACDCGAAIPVRKCANHKDHADQLKECEACGYTRGGIGDPVQEIVHGSDGPNAVIATALHELLPEGRRKVLAFADSRQEAAFFAWYAEDSYEKVRDRNLILRALRTGAVEREGLSVDDLRNRLRVQWEKAGLFKASDTGENKNRHVLTAVLREALTDEKRLSLAGVGLVKWFVALPPGLQVPSSMRRPPWNFTEAEARRLIGYLLDDLRNRFAMNLPAGAGSPQWSDVSPVRSQRAYCKGPRGGRRNISQWGGAQSGVVKHFLRRLLANSDVPDRQKQSDSQELMKELWSDLRRHEETPFLSRADVNGTFRLNPDWLRVKPADPGEVWECETCATLTTHNVRGICPRNRCPGTLAPADQERLTKNHYRRLYGSGTLPPALRAEEHTAQIASDEARRRQREFKDDAIDLLSSSTTFEVGVDLGDLDVVFLRNVPPEPFNYTQRVGRAGRRGENTGLALTYCRRNPHDLYHYEDPIKRVVNGTVHPPRLRMTNEKIVLRHMAATALSAFFKEEPIRFKRVEDFVGDWQNPRARLDLRKFCDTSSGLTTTLRAIVPEALHKRTGLATGTWVDRIAGNSGRLADKEAEVCADYRDMERHRQDLFNQRKGTNQAEARMRTIAREQTLGFLSRKAVIPKYGFPVDVVELDTHPRNRNSAGVALQRDLSQAIAEYAPGGKVVARKLEWESRGLKKVQGKDWTRRKYRYNSALDFRRWKKGDPEAPADARRYVIPKFGFVTPLPARPKPPRGRTRRLYTTRPFFQGFDNEAHELQTKVLAGVRVTKAQPGTLVILCEGRNRAGFYICSVCGTHDTRRKPKHKSPSGRECKGSLACFSLGHELETDVVRVQFPGLRGEEDAYSVGYAVLLGAAETLDVPDTDLNVTVTGAGKQNEAAIVLYDNVPGGAGLVAQLENEAALMEVLQTSRSRVQGGCGCDSSCYGCLRSYRNQFAHPHLSRLAALKIIASALG